MVTDNNQGNSVPSADPEDFFGNLEDAVNGVVTQGKEDNANEATHVPEAQQPQNNVAPTPPRGTNWQKRYKDSSREAIKMSKQLSELKPFVPVLEAMKRDSGLVEHVRDYLKEGGSPNKSIKDKLGLDEDFTYDPHEAMDNPDSDSAKLQQAHIDSLVQARVGEILTREKQNAAKTNMQMMQKRKEIEFAKKHNMSPAQFNQFKQAAKARKLTLDDVYHLVNKDQSTAKIANNAKEDVLNQMKNVRDIPTTASHANNQGTSERSPEDKLFSDMMSLDDDVDNLFG
tara:strand:- start:458 stop:1312 length:855 start_codon:yes stop_codon:yes gene_type:complete